MRGVVCRLHLKYAGSLGDALQHAGLVAVLQEDGPVVVHILHLHKHGGRACPATARWTVVCGQKQTDRQRWASVDNGAAD